ncbi:MAG: Gfo/Idh/MocA family oxidoreductase [Planctomycetaceae bacterium]|nr:Gfo/Idh/MocA family oxidoreductase [Planctomycetales bacterium]MCB9925179.1 Gfo/Idh/MocA family oxidoreductase [Planctomycetaceae bacterium]
MIRIGIVGCGRILAAHLRGYQLLRAAGVDNFRITALCARRESDAWSYVRRGEGPAQREPVSTSPGDPLAVGDVFLSDLQNDVEVEVFTDYREMIAAGKIDAVNDFTTHALHHQVAEAALAHDKHLLTQKPLAVSVAAGRRMCDQAEARDLTLAVFENARNRADTRQLGWLFQSGCFGELKMILLANIGNWWAPDRIVAETPWRHQLVEGGGITLDIGVHLFNHFRFVAGEIAAVTGNTRIVEPRRFTRDSQGQVVASVNCDADDTMFATFETEQGVIGNIAASWSGHGQPLLTGQGRGIVYYGTAGSVVGNEIARDDGTHDELSSVYERQCEPIRQQRHFPLGLTDAFALNQLDWLQAISEKRAPETSGREGLRDLAASFAVLESSLAKRTVEVDEVLSGALRKYQQPIDSRFGLLS